MCASHILGTLYILEEVYGFKLRSWFDRHNLAVFLVIIRINDGSITVVFVKTRQITGAQSLSKQFRNLEPYISAEVPM